MWHWLALLSPRRLAAAAKISANLELYQHLDRERAKSEQLRAENDALRTELQQVQQRATMQEAARHESGAVWFGEGHAPANGPYCPTCWGHEERRVHMVLEQRSGDRVKIRVRCGHCKTAIWIPDPDLDDDEGLTP